MARWTDLPALWAAFGFLGGLVACEFAHYLDAPAPEPKKVERAELRVFDPSKPPEFWVAICRAEGKTFLASRGDAEEWTFECIDGRSR